MPVLARPFSLAVHEKKVNALEDLCVLLCSYTNMPDVWKEGVFLYIFDDTELVPIFYEELLRAVLTSEPWGKGQLSKQAPTSRCVSPVYCTNRKADGGVSISIIHIPTFSTVYETFSCLHM